MIETLPPTSGAILILNGPNLLQVGNREPEIYGSCSLVEYLIELRDRHSDLQIETRFSSYEGDLIEYLHAADIHKYGAVLLNAGGYTHTSVALADAIRTIRVPVIEVHISQIQARESYRHTSLLAPYCRGSISGFGLESYALGLAAAKTLLS